MKHLIVVLTAMITITSFTGCAGVKKVNLAPGVPTEITVLYLGADTTMLNQDQIDLLNENLDWMVSDLMQTST